MYLLALALSYMLQWPLQQPGPSYVPGWAQWSSCSILKILAHHHRLTLPTEPFAPFCTTTSPGWRSTYSDSMRSADTGLHISIVSALAYRQHTVSSLYAHRLHPQSQGLVSDISTPS